MRLITAITLLWVFSVCASGQVLQVVAVPADTSRQIADSPDRFFGPFRINGEKPEGFESFNFFILGYAKEEDAQKDNRDALLPDKDGDVTVRGELIVGSETVLAFERAKLIETGPITDYYKGETLVRTVRSKPVTLTFSTVEAASERYEFVGEYLETPLEEHGGLTELRGSMKRFKNGKIVAEAKIVFKRLTYQQLESQIDAVDDR